MKNITILSIWGPILQVVLRNRESANWPKMEQFGGMQMEQFEKFSIISYTNLKLKGGQFNGKKYPS